MKTLAACLVSFAAVMAATPCRGPWPAETAPFSPDPVESIVSCSAMVDTMGGSGSCVFVFRKKAWYAITNAHVVATARGPDGKYGKVEVVRQINPAGRRQLSEERVSAEVVACCDKHDLALLKLDAKVAKWPIISAVLAHGKPSPVGAPIWHVGSMFGKRGYNSLSNGIVSHTGRLRTNGNPDLKVILFDQVAVTAFPGSSGGGVFRADGRLLGILSEYVGPGPRSHGLFCYIPVRRMKTWAEEQKVEWALD